MLSCPLVPMEVYRLLQLRRMEMGPLREIASVLCFFKRLVRIRHDTNCRTSAFSRSLLAFYPLDRSYVIPSALLFVSFICFLDFTAAHVQTNIGGHVNMHPHFFRSRLLGFHIPELLVIHCAHFFHSFIEQSSPSISYPIH